ncbi:hypothetical protein ACTJKC_06930 [Pedobacter sp. 22226]|uniref:hypothetical protein n=1 Tax=Pedobacter sp. 22226 TaxID=3453894 RepID=UPI003F835052
MNSRITKGISKCDISLSANKSGCRKESQLFSALIAGCKAGYKFYLSANNVWLTDVVPAEYIEF